MGRPLERGPRNSRCPSERGGTRSSRPLRTLMDFCAIADRRSTPDPGSRATDPDTDHLSEHLTDSADRVPCAETVDTRRFIEDSTTCRWLRAKGRRGSPNMTEGNAVIQWAIAGCSPVRGVYRPTTSRDPGHIGRGPRTCQIDVQDASNSAGSSERALLIRQPFAPEILRNSGVVASTALDRTAHRLFTINDLSREPPSAQTWHLPCSLPRQ